MLKEKENVIRKAIILLDALIVTLAFFLSYFIRNHFNDLGLFPSTYVISNNIARISDYIVVLFFVVPFWCFMLYFNGMYRSFRTGKVTEIIKIVLISSFFTLLGFGAFVFLFKLGFVSRMFFAIFLAISSFFIFFEKMAIYFITHHVRKRGYNFRRLVVVGKGKRAANFIDKIKSHPEWGIKIIGTIDDQPGHGTNNIENVKVLGDLEDLPHILHNDAIDEVVFVVPRLRLNSIENSIYVCETEGVKATIAVDLFNAKIAKAHPTEIDNIPLLTFETTVAKEWQLFVKRAMDIIISGLSIIILSPLFLIIAILIKLTSSGPVLYKQERVCLNGRKFMLYKFRTMYKGAEKKLLELKILNEMDGPVFKIKKDPRITLIGRILRKFSIDEFPQLFNVFVGHMSLIGPRPPIPDEVEQYESWQRRRLSMRPGLTCLWQVSGRNKIDFDEWMRLDLQYLDNWSLWLDCKIMVKTIPVVLFGIGAY